MTSDETEIQIFADWPMSHANRVTKDNRKNPEYPEQNQNMHIFCILRNLKSPKLA